jgi:hypothetical protein
MGRSGACKGRFSCPAWRDAESHSQGLFGALGEIRALGHRLPWAHLGQATPAGMERHGIGDWLGPRKVLMRIVMWWSFLAAATGSNLTKSFTAWLPQKERVAAQGIMWTSARWGGAFTREQDARKNSSHPRCTAVDLPQTERLVFGIDYQLERDLAPRRHPASGPKPS